MDYIEKFIASEFKAQINQFKQEKGFIEDSLDFIHAIDWNVFFQIKTYFYHKKDRNHGLLDCFHFNAFSYLLFYLQEKTLIFKLFYFQFPVKYEFIFKK